MALQTNSYTKPNPLSVISAERQKDSTLLFLM